MALKHKVKVRTNPESGYVFKTLTIKEENDIPFMMDHAMYEGIPTGIEFAVEYKTNELFSKSNILNLIGDGYGLLVNKKEMYGMSGEYGNGSIGIYINRVPADILESLGIVIDPEWKIELEKVKQLPHRQDSIADQLKDLAVVANKFGMFTASDWFSKLYELNEVLNDE